MKLDAYLIKEAVDIEDWETAIQILLSHFCIVLPKQKYKVEILRYYGWTPQIEIQLPIGCYSWNNGEGIDTWDRRHNLPSSDPRIDIYMPQEKNKVLHRETFFIGVQKENK